MAAITRKIFFGALYDFSSNAADEVIESFYETLTNPVVPFVSYDKSNKVFSFTYNQNDDDAVALFKGQIKAYVDQQQHHQDLLESPKLRPFQGTVFEDQLSLIHTQFASTDGDLLSMSSGGDDSEEEADTVTVGHSTTYWKPVSGDIQILPASVVKTLADLTGSSFNPEAENCRVRIYGGDEEKALSKLQNLEKLLALLSTQRLQESWKAAGNVLVLPTKDEAVRLEFRPLLNNPGAYRRIIVDDMSQTYLDKKATVELRDFDAVTSTCSIPENLNLHNASTIAETPPPKSSQIWDNFEFAQFGKSTNLLPELPSAAESDVDQDTIHATVPTSQYMTQNKTSRVVNWAKTVEETADPNKIAVEPPKEIDKKKSGRQRKVRKSDSDDEDQVGLSKPSSPDRNLSSKPAADVSDSDELASYGLLRTPSPPAQTLQAHGAQEHVPQVQTTPVTHQISEKSPSPTRYLSYPLDFDLNKYGPTQRNRANDATNGQWNLVGRGGKCAPPGAETSQPGRGTQDTKKHQDRGQGRGRGRGRGQPAHLRDNNQAKNPTGANRRADPIPGRTRPFNRGMRQSGRHQNGRGDQSQNKELVQLAADHQSPRVLPPPGLVLLEQRTMSRSTTTENLIDITTDESPHTPLVSRRSSEILVDVASDVQLPTNVDEPSEDGTVYVNAINPGMKMSAIMEYRIDKLRQKKARDAEQHGSKSSSPSNEKVQETSEVDTRQYHRTMSHKAPNPGKRGKQGGQGSPANKASKGKQETKKEKEARIANVLQEAHGAPSPSKRSDAFTDTNIPAMSARKKAILSKSGRNIEILGGRLEDPLRPAQVEKLTSDLLPIFDAARTFFGALSFEIQFGQALVPPPQKLYHSDFYTLREWEQMFHPTNGQTPFMTSFTNILTTNGVDVDQMLEMRAIGGSTAKLWSGIKPELGNVTYEFHCQSKENEVFWLVIDEKRPGKYELRRAPQTVGMVNLIFPGQIWDACAHLSGTSTFHSNDVVSIAAARFVDSLYVPGGRKHVSLTYRLPDTNVMTVQKVVMKRSSLHSCLMLDKHDFQLQITEVQTLFHRIHTKDRKLYQAYAKEFEDMVQEGRMHYEVALVNKSIHAQLVKNKTLELGESADWHFNAMMRSETIKSILDIVNHIETQIDAVGLYNIGSLQRRDHAEQQGAGQLESVGVAGSRIAPSGIVGIGPSQAPARLKGVRGGQPELVEGGQYYLGQGYALVPVVREESTDVVPADSVSQAAGPSASTEKKGPSDPREQPGYW